MERDEAIKRIRDALKKRSGKAWSVKHGRGTVSGWIDVDAPPARQANADAERAELAKLLGLDAVHSGGVSIPASYEYRREYVDRAEGRTPSVIGVPYWD